MYRAWRKRTKEERMGLTDRTVSELTEPVDATRCSLTL